MPNIRPSSELRNNYAGLIKTSRESREPIYLTVNGRGDSVIMPIEEYERLQNIIAVNALLMEAEEDIRNDRVYEHESVFTDVIQRLQQTKAAQKNEI